jgi:hypothetical protein
MTKRTRIIRRIAALAAVASLGIGAVSLGISTSPGGSRDAGVHALKTRH